MKIGLLCGREYSFPPAFLQKVNELGKRDNVTAEFVQPGRRAHGRARAVSRDPGSYLSRSGISTVAT